MIGYGLSERPAPPRSFSERLDAAIALFSPRWAAERVAWRRARADLERFGYRSATRSRTDRPASSVRGSATWHLEAAYQRENMMFRARELERDNGLADGLLTRSVENVVGIGIRPQARTKDKAWNKAAEARFAKWAKECDVRGFDSFYALQALTFRSYLRDGDVGTLFLSDGRLQSVEADQIADPPGMTGNARFIDGVETDIAGRPIRYHVVDERDVMYGKGVPDRRSIVKRIEIPAEDMLFLSRRKRLNQTRGEPIFAQGAWLFDQIDGNVEAVTIAARIAACFGLVVKRGAPYSGLPTTTGADGKSYRDWAIEPGMVKEIEATDSLEQINPHQPTQNFSEFIALMARLVGIPLGLPYELVFLDFSKTNFSSARASLIQAYKTFRAHQVRLVESWCEPIWKRCVRRWIDGGELPEVPDWDAHAWTLPGWQWVDPKAEVDSALTAIDAGIKTLHDVITEQGRDYDEVIATRAQEIKDFEAAKIPLVRSASTRDPIDPEAAAQKAGGGGGAKKKPASDEESAEVARMDRLEGMIEGMARASAHPVTVAGPTPSFTLAIDQATFKLPEQAPPIVNVEFRAPEQPPVVVNVTALASEQPAPVVNVTVPSAPPTPVNVTAVPGEVTVKNEISVEVEAKLPPPAVKKATVKAPGGGETEITIRPVGG